MRRPPPVKSYVVDLVSLLLSIQTVRLPFALFGEPLGGSVHVGIRFGGCCNLATAFSRLSEMSSLSRAVTRTERLNRSKLNDVLCLCVNPFFRRSLFLWLLFVRYSHHRYLWIMPPSVESAPGWFPMWRSRGNVHRFHP
jgi:hypothetical protein